MSVISPKHLGRATFRENFRDAAREIRTALAIAKLDDVYVFVSWRVWQHIEERRAILGPMPVPVHLFADREIETLFHRPQLQIGGFRGF